MKILLKNIFSDSIKEEITIEEIRKQLLLWLLILLNILALPALIIGVVGAIKLGETRFAIAQILLFAPIIFTFVFQKKISYKFSVYIIISSAYIISILNTIMYSFGGASLAIMFTIAIITTVLLGYKSGFIVMFSFVIPMGIIAYLMVNGYIVMEVDLQAAIKDPMSWFSALASTLFLGTIVVFAYAVIQRNLLQSLKIVHEQADSLSNINQQLQKDIDHRIEVQKALEIAKKQAEESDNLKTEFLSNMSHEVRTPMNSIIGFSDLLKTPDISKESLLTYSTIISDNANQLMSIMNSILDFSQLKSKQVELNMKDVNLNALCFELSQSFTTQATEKNITLTVDNKLSDNESVIYSDEKKLNQILYNIMENAIKYTDVGTVILSCKKQNDNIQICIKDTGIGINPENQISIFDSFSQEEKGIARPSEGLGLGLSIAKEIIELLGGSISLESSKGKGSSFFINLPTQNIS